ncbi:hypothetical protein E8E13_006705 [Curvularia kusanoi]|uniref:Uncharacterized protein n=1 Tax=Curvularia kusanoi TaxID=90978 RepID=A0A9P4T8C2_CURKU|nr:hypothetical protein E8E13_006705 [Curvularia kusanoi]
MPPVRLEERVPSAFNFFINNGNINNGHMNGNQDINDVNVPAPVIGIPDFVVRAHNRVGRRPVSYAAEAAGRDVLAALGVEIKPLPKPQLQPERPIVEIVGEGDPQGDVCGGRRREKKEEAGDEINTNTPDLVVDPSLLREGEQGSERKDAQGDAETVTAMTTATTPRPDPTSYTRSMSAPMHDLAIVITTATTVDLSGLVVHILTRFFNCRNTQPIPCDWKKGRNTSASATAN